MNKLLIIILGILPLDIYAQPSEEITLQEVMNLAQKRSLEAIEAKNKVLIYISTLENLRKAGVGKSPNQSFLFI